MMEYFCTCTYLFISLKRKERKKERKKVKPLSHVQFFVTPWTVAYQAPPSMGFSRQEYWSRLPFPSPGDLPNPGIEPRSPTLQTDTLPSEPPGMQAYISEVRIKQENSSENLHLNLLQ